jgi:adenylate kinase
LLLGPPGSGKGTQAVRITKELGIPHISTGDLFRANMKENTALGMKAKSFINAGKLVPDEVVIEMLLDRVANPDCKNGYLLDGFPRTLGQAKAFEEQLDKNSTLIVLDLEVPDEVIIKRVAGRYTCQSCGNIVNCDPKLVGACEKCSGKLIKREDDKPEVVEERLRVYHKETKPLVDYYQKKGLLHTVDGTKSPDQVFKALMEFLP